MFTINIEDSTKLFFTSDTHFDHYNIARYCNRPFESRSQMNQSLIGNWNAVVPEDGIVIHCGDFMLPHKEDIKAYWKHINKLNGTIYLCRGNHDRIAIGIYDTKGIRHDITEAISDIKLVVVDIMTVIVGDTKIFAQHYPCITFNANYQVFGHIHTQNDGMCHNLADESVRQMIQTNQYDVGVDQNDYKPISYEQLMKKL